MLPLQPLGDDRERGLPLGPGAAGREPAHHAQIVLVALRLRRLRQHERRPHLGSLGELEGRRRDADHDVGLGVDRDRLADDGLAAIDALPQRVTEYGDPVLPLASLLGEEAAAGDRSDAYGLEERRADPVALDPLGGLAAAQAGVPPQQPDQIAEGARRLRLPVEQVGGRHVREIDAVEVAPRLVHAHQPLLVRERESAQHDRVEHVEDDGVGGEPERERRDQEDTRSPALDERPESEAGVFEHGSSRRP